MPLRDEDRAPPTTSVPPHLRNMPPRDEDKAPPTTSVPPHLRNKFPQPSYLNAARPSPLPPSTSAPNSYAHIARPLGSTNTPGRPIASPSANLPASRQPRTPGRPTTGPSANPPASRQPSTPGRPVASPGANPPAWRQPRTPDRPTSNPNPDRPGQSSAPGRPVTSPSANPPVQPNASGGPAGSPRFNGKVLILRCGVRANFPQLNLLHLHLVNRRRISDKETLTTLLPLVRIKHLPVAMAEDSTTRYGLIPRRWLLASKRSGKVELRF
jgi:hypothetical protein